MYNRYDEQLVKEVKKFYESASGKELTQKTGKPGRKIKMNSDLEKDLRPILHTVGAWMEDYARRKKWNGDELSEVYITITEKFLHILLRFKKNGYANFSSYLGKYVKNCRMNILRKEFEKNNPALFELWDEERNFQRILIPEDNQKGNENIRNVLLALKPLNRIVISMRYNLALPKSETDSFLSLMNESDKKEMIGRKEKIQQSEKRYLERLTRLTGRILKKKDGERQMLSERKKRLVKKIMRPRELFSISELGKILGMPESRIARVCKVSINQIREEYEKSLKHLEQ